ncbi:hypothetical protein KAS31_05020, partial [Candidatus Parcubacteria bacterium]|nr:hypothetical protein [Candidatus Parcubacteria bacterium]
RYLFLTAHYRSKLNFTWKSLEASQNALNKLYDFIALPDTAIAEKSQLNSKIELQNETQITAGYEKQFLEALENNLDTPRTLAIIWEMIKSKDLNYDNKKTTLLKFDKVLGLNLDKVKKEKIEISDDIKKLIKQREEARKNKDWKEADRLRDEIKKNGLAVKDKSIE